MKTIAMQLLADLEGRADKLDVILLEADVEIDRGNGNVSAYFVDHSVIHVVNENDVLTFTLEGDEL